ncbi:MAG: response regulator [Myxococcota bacterium]|nr:response regulator [Myxococcota bacterium]
MALFVIADDHDQIRTMIKQTLNEMGHESRLCSDGDHALDALRCEKDAVALITDVFMSSMDGRELVGIIRGGPPRLRKMPVILISGALDSPNLPSYLEDDLCHFLQKPFTQAELSKVVEKAVKQVNQRSTSIK